MRCIKKGMPARGVLLRGRFMVKGIIDLSASDLWVLK
jgi:hypothetical protein